MSRQVIRVGPDPQSVRCSQHQKSGRAHPPDDLRSGHEYPITDYLMRYRRVLEASLHALSERRILLNDGQAKRIGPIGYAHISHVHDRALPGY